MVARRAGMAVAYLGADIPIEDWVSAADGAAAAVIGVVTGRDRKAALQVARALRAAHPRLVVAFGGDAAPASSEAADTLTLPASLPASVGALRSALERRPA